MVFVKTSCSRRFISPKLHSKYRECPIGKKPFEGALLFFFFLFGKWGKPVGRLDFFSEH